MFSGRVRCSQASSSPAYAFPRAGRYPDLAKSSGTNSAAIRAADAVNGLRLRSKKFIQPRMYIRQTYAVRLRAPRDKQMTEA
jgi:hypothetical protein